ncbi:hypothetical protein ACWET9_22480 [Streptomyces sp. NPDC004059]
MTGIDKSAMERIGGVRDGRIEYTAFFNHVQAGTGLHERLSLLPRSDQILTYCRGTNLGDPAASLVSKQINYDPNRADDGMFTFGVSAQGNGFGIEWGQQLTAGVRTDTAATNGSSIDTTASASFGGQAYLQAFSFTGTDVTVKIQDSADNATFADVAGFSFTQITGGTPSAERIALGSTATLRRYLRVSTVTTGGFTSLAFAVNVIKNESAVTF